MNENEPLGILDLLCLRGFKPGSRPYRLVRHQDARFDVNDLLRRGLFDTYQSFQSKGRFDGVDYIVSFIGVGGTQAKFIGVYEVLSCKPGRSVQLPKHGPDLERLVGDYYYEMRKLPGFAELERRVVIEWGKGTRSWIQLPRNKEVVEIVRKGQLLRPFNDYLGFTLTYDELQSLHAEPEANREWRARLSAVAGVYLVLATTTGAQYVGSASGADGFWGRWASYAVNGHGGNKLLKKLIDTDHAYPGAFSYSILQILPRTVTQAAVLEWERLYKEKLGSRAVGLNAN